MKNLLCVYFGLAVSFGACDPSLPKLEGSMINSDSYKLELQEMLPSPPERGSNTWTIKVSSNGSSEKLEGCEIDLVPFMPEHGHGSPKQPDTIDLGDGIYQVTDIVFTMPGLWSMEFTVACNNGDREQLVYEFRL